VRWGGRDGGREEKEGVSADECEGGRGVGGRGGLGGRGGSCVTKGRGTVVIEAWIVLGY